MSNVNFNAARPGTRPMGAKTGPIDLAALEQLVEALPIKDVNAVKGGAAHEPQTLPAIFQQLSVRDQQALMELPASVRNKVLAGVPADVDAAKFQISQELLRMSGQLVPGAGVKFEPARAFRVSDAAIAYGVLSNLSPGDRQALDGVTFRRVKSTLFDADHQSRETDGAASFETEKGRGVAGKLGFKLAQLFEQFALTAPLGLMLKAWFPHALGEYQNRFVDIGDAQATRMKEVLVHEIGHQVQFGKDFDMAGMQEWAKLSGWAGPDGGEAFGVDDQGRVKALNASVRPTRTDNFVYENFTEDLSPEQVRKAAASIQDPELRAEFEQTVKIKRNMQAAVKEIFGVEAMGYSMVNPLEDFAESYRAFYLDTELLVRKAPDKFLYLNAQTQRYSAEQVKVFFERAGKDPKAVATGLAETGLSQETVDKIFKANGLAADVGALAAKASAALQAGGDVPAFRQAFMRVQQKAAEKDLAFISAFHRDPAKALGDLWGKMTPAEQAQFGDEAKRAEIVQKMQRGQMSYASAAAQGYKEIEVQAIRGFGTRLLDDGAFRAALKADPAAALGQIEGELPAVLKAAVADPATAKSFSTFAETLDDLIAYDKIPLLGGGDLHKLFEENLKRLDEATLKASLGTLREDPKKMAEVFTGLSTATHNGVQVPPGG